jgi:hypothetical protein
MLGTYGVSDRVALESESREWTMTEAHDKSGASSGSAGDALFLCVADVGDFRRIANELTRRRPAHVFLQSADIDVLSELRRLWLEGKIYSAYVTTATFDVQVFVNEFDALPVFEVADAAGGRAIADRLIRDPYRVAGEAINGADVLKKYGEGRPS